MDFLVDGYNIIIPVQVLQDFKDTIKIDLDEDQVSLYACISRQRHQNISSEQEYAKYVIEELYREISRYDTFRGRHYY